MSHRARAHFASLAVAAGIAAVVSASCGGSAGKSSSSSSSSSVPDARPGSSVPSRRSSGEDAAGPLQTVFLILLENTNWSLVKGNSAAPYLNSLLAKGAHAENYFENPKAIHPSEPNYIWLEVGDNLGITDDAEPPANHKAVTKHLVTLLSAAGISWRAYVEDIPAGTCPITSSGLFAPKHTAMLYFDDIVGNPPSKTSAPCIEHIVPYQRLTSDLAANAVAKYNFITPNLCNDMHGALVCPRDLIHLGDTWLSAEVPKIMGSDAYKHNGAIFITWDESVGGEAPIGMIVLSPKAKVGYSNTIRYYHSSMLRTVQEVFHVTPLLNDAANQPNLSDLFTSYP